MPSFPSSPSAGENCKPDTGTLGENLVAHWLQQQGWVILRRRWRCRWGELDLIAQQASGSQCRLQETALAFVEVKTRRRWNWDAGGLLAITEQKQAKLRKAAEMFLAECPDLADLPCRFDVALVSFQPLAPKQIQANEIRTDAGTYALGQPIILGQPVFAPSYQLTLIDYIESAFAEDG
ncbi:MAG: YraN family protein [Microcoleus vaginatus WJT46-NPBG5]|jgi:putative endonuclease|nr:YraN family protein [Microcoleus vaginatus WJT46-NPBG5]